MILGVALFILASVLAAFNGSQIQYRGSAKYSTQMLSEQLILWQKPARFLLIIFKLWHARCQ
jgi:hypothetical protein